MHTTIPILFSLKYFIHTSIVTSDCDICYWDICLHHLAPWEASAGLLHFDMSKF